MKESEGVKLKYIGFLMFSILICAGLLMFGNYWIPVRITQETLMSNRIYTGGIMEEFLNAESSIKSGNLLLMDNIPKRIWTENSEISIIKMVDEKKLLPSTKYRIEMKFRHPNTVINRSMKLDAIVVDTKLQQNHDFADLFWSLE
jgi:uncharacterized protein (UPF0333 family)